MHELGEGLGEPVGERLYHDGVVVVVVPLEAKRRLISPESGCDGEESTWSSETRAPGGDEVGERAVRTASGFCLCWRRKWRLVSVSSRDPSV